MEGCEVSCSFYGCKRTFKNQEKLNLHLQAHRKDTAQSLPGKVFLCSHIGCQGSFNNMQQLMEHMRHHHKPNIFYQCESCRAKLRSYRTLLKHLQTCAKVAKNKAMKMEPGILPDSDGVPFTSAEMENSGLVAPEMPEMTPVPSLQTNPSMDDMPVLQRFALNNNFTNPMPSSGILPFGNLSQGIDDNLPGQAPYSTYQTPPVNSAFSSDPGLQQQRSPRAGPPSLPSSPPMPLSPGSNAVWRKNQAQTFNFRILWEHTRGRYSCLQCVYYTPDRGEMTAHIEEVHKNPNGKMNNDLETESGTAPLLTKPSQYSENSTYTQL